MAEELAGAPPPYIRETIDEARSFVRTAASFVRHPFRFSRAWAQGEARAMNPIGFFGAATGVHFAAEAIAEHFRGPDPDSVFAKLRSVAPTLFWLGELLSQQLPLATALIFALAIHRRLRKKAQQPFTSSLGVVLFAEGIDQLWFALFALIGVVTTSKPVKDFGQSANGLLELVLLTAALAGVHNLRRWREAVWPVIYGFIITTLVVGIAIVPLMIVSKFRDEREGKATNMSLHFGKATVAIKTDEPTDAGPVDGGSRVAGAGLLDAGSLDAGTRATLDAGALDRGRATLDARMLDAGFAR